LQSISPIAALKALPKLPFAELLADVRREPRAFVKDLVAVIPAAQRLLDVARREKLDHIHVHSAGRAALIAALARAMGGPPYSLTLHGPRLEDYGPGQRFKWRHANFGTAVTDGLLADLRTRLLADAPERIVVQPMGVDTERLSRDAPWLPPEPGQSLNLFCCTRLNPVKGHEYLFSALKALRDDGLNVHLTIAGEDDIGGNGFRKELELRAHEMGCADSVAFLGAIDEGEVRRQLLATHIFVLPSLREALPVALLEAMSCGVPSVSTDVGGVASVITDGENGLLVPAANPAALASAVARLGADPELAHRIGLAARGTIVSRFGSEHGAGVVARGALSRSIIS
jgi:glycosyltransferase involved in cell wall biosynthesis